MRDRRGFTLLELVLALSITAVVLLVSLSSVRFAAGLWESGQRTADRGWINRYFMAVFQSEVSSAFPYGRDEGIFFSGTHERLAFVSAGFGEGLPWGGARFVAYGVEGGSLVVKEQALPEAEEGSLPVTTELSREVERVSFSYLGANGWIDEWDGTEKKALPKAVRASVHIKGSENVVEFSIPVMLGNKGNE